MRLKQRENPKLTVSRRDWRNRLRHPSMKQPCTLAWPAGNLLRQIRSDGSPRTTGHCTVQTEASTGRAITPEMLIFGTLRAAADLVGLARERAHLQFTWTGGLPTSPLKTAITPIQSGFHSMDSTLSPLTTDSGTRKKPTLELTSQRWVTSTTTRQRVAPMFLTS